MSVRPSEGDPAGILHVVADQRIATGVLQGLLDVWGFVADDVDHQLGPPELPQLLVCGLHLWDDTDARFNVQETHSEQETA